MLIALYFIITRINRFEFTEIPGGAAAIEKAMSELGAMTDKEKRIFVIFIITILLWAFKSVHQIDANTVAILSVMLMLSPVIGVAIWKDVVNKIEWGTILLFGAGISLGESLLSSGAAIWLSKTVLSSTFIKTYWHWLGLI